MDKNGLFQDFYVNESSSDIINVGGCGVSRSGVCFKQFTPLDESFHSGYVELRRELTSLMVKQTLRYGIDCKFHNDKNILFHNTWSSGYYHWLIEAVPRLLSQRRTWAGSRILIPEKIPNNWFESWLMNISGGNLIKMHRGLTFLSNVSFARNPKTILEFSNPDLQETSDYFMHYLGISKASGKKSLFYISRRRAGHRRISNEPELIASLESIGFIAVEMEDLDFPSQVKLFSDADIIVSPHGAALSNAIFMNKNSTIIEIFPQPNSSLTYGTRRKTYLLNSCYRAIAHCLHIKHIAVLGNYDAVSTPTEVVKKYGTLHGNIYVDPSAVISAVRSL
ncbi:glycosyltransferase family 61 protein [Yoonia sp.]|uniref:glycosyltransferase family 61 protein n=1 Tax=Yoonia sp. TaxID=2212373 RepID=UPI00391B485D